MKVRVIDESGWSGVLEARDALDVIEAPIFERPTEGGMFPSSLFTMKTFRRTSERDQAGLPVYRNKT